MKKLTFFIILLFSTAGFSQNKTDSLFIAFKKSSFYESVYPAKMQLENRQKEIIPELIKLLKDTTFVKLTGTGDLIYPGATEFYGHGHYVPYDMDWISVRAGWLLEELTFQDFGYKIVEIDEKDLIKLMKDNYPEYIHKGKLNLTWKKKNTKEKWIEFRNILALNAENWWKKNQKDWTRMNAIKEALTSKNENQLSDVIQYLRYGETACEGLTKESYEKEIKPIVESLILSEYTDNTRIVIEYLIRDGLGTDLKNRK
ncbi:hypothetical protein NAT51_14115 [Flavobacterium amniphilum]|uniref:hypothetical protein n=1 Tax=Flavobacterium amniphilum TaxID=1834035 RepID=UPI00202A5219|nr:hypothetical protein [Flavobacterium amniphilum]MCL9806667.1 hypothetical protein [Flavobacterium amniphilum]